MPRPARPAPGQHADGRGPCALQHAGAFVDRRPRRQHIVDDDEPLAGDAAARPDRKRAADVARPRQRVRGDLATAFAGGEPASRRDRRAARGMDRCASKRRLVVAPGGRAGSNAAAPGR